MSRYHLFGGLFLMLTAVFICTNPTMSFSDNQSKPIDTQNFDTSIKPSSDFYQFANGGWMTRNPIPGDQSRWGSFNEVQERNFKILHEILDEAAAKTDAPRGSVAQKVGDFYFSSMDTVAIEKAGAKPLDAEFERIAAVSSTDDLQALIAHLHSIGVGVPFRVSAEPDAKKSTDVIAQLYQAGLGLPDRDYYTKTDDQSKQLRDQYVAHVAKMLELLGDDASSASASAASILEFETRLATASMTRVDRRDPDKTYHKMTADELGALTPNLTWPTYFANIGIPNAGPVNVGMPDFFKEVNAMLAAVPLKDWKTYLRWHLIHDAADLLSSSFVNENFNFFGKTLNGVKELKPRWKRCLQTVDGNIGEALGQLYVEKAFTPQAKAKALQLVENLRKALGERIQKLDWMSDATKQQALHKLNAFAVKIGYPDKWRDYSTLDIDRGSYVLNAMRASIFEFKRNMAQIGKPVDKTEWGMTPPTVNAYYNPSFNEIVFPAGILQPPFFDEHADDAVNYGGIGAVIGHEMTHGFDDQGRKFDADGNLKEWWTPEDAQKYLSHATQIENQYSDYVALDTLHVNGKLTLGENIADLGGVTIAYVALQKALEANGRPDKIDGFNPDQRFFLSWAQIWRQNARPENLKVRLITDPHSPGRFRCIGVISNLQEFQKAFGIPDSSPMTRKEKVQIW
ncbi:MAG: M13 family metallopeptidase [Ignavibacteriae bacterium]|nr:M13 family metallopeptidase [Ignavibacteriota bacterium]